MTSAQKALPNVLIMTPMKNALRHVEGYVTRIEHLTYPKELLSIGILEGDSTDKTWSEVQSHRERLEQRCCSVTLAKRDFHFHMPDYVPRWTPAYQLARRITLARARNHLLFSALRNEDFVLWLDVDVVSFPQDLVETLIAMDLDIVQPHCVTVTGGPTFDLNAWTHHGSKHLDSYRGRTRPVRLDSVGGTVLLIKADFHRDGLIFPAYRYGVPNAAMRPNHPVWGQGEIETEGLGIMAADMGLQCWGLPNYEVIHDSELSIKRDNA